jgi:hypothetical protein
MVRTWVTRPPPPIAIENNFSDSYDVHAFALIPESASAPRNNPATAFPAEI